jgi:hypothetical protein
MHQESGGFYDLGITSVILEIRQYNNQQYDYVLYLYTYTSFFTKVHSLKYVPLLRGYKIRYIQ